MQISSPEAESSSPTGSSDDAVAQFLAEHVEPLRTRQASIDSDRPHPLPTASRLLAEALAARRITVRKITDGRWTFVFAGTTIGGYVLPTVGNGVTTLVSAQARRVLRDASKVRAHFDLVDIPHPPPLPSMEEDDATPALFNLESLTPEPSGSAIHLQAYTVGPETVSILAVVPDHAGRALSVDVTDRVCDQLQTLAVDAMRAIPGLLCASVALETASLDSAENAQVVGIDEAASIVPHHFPRLGRGQPVADAIAEQILFTAAL